MMAVGMATFWLHDQPYKTPNYMKCWCKVWCEKVWCENISNSFTAHVHKILILKFCVLA